MISFHEVINKILSRDSNYFADLDMWPKFGDCSISTREVNISLILLGFVQKKALFCGVALVQVQ